MSKLPLVDAKAFEHLLIALGFTKTRQKGIMLFIVTRMGEQPHFHTMPVGLFPVRFFVRFCER